MIQKFPSLFLGAGDEYGLRNIIFPIGLKTAVICPEGLVLAQYHHRAVPEQPGFDFTPRRGQLQ